MWAGNANVEGRWAGVAPVQVQGAGRNRQDPLWAAAATGK